MGQDIPPAPPEAEVIRLARKATGMTAESAAAASKARDPSGRGVGSTYWLDVERGRGGRRGKQVAIRASDRALAVMARAVGVESRQLTEAGREDAARVLEEILRRERALAARPPADPVRAKAEDFARRYGIDPADERDPILAAVRREVRAAVATYGENVPGALVFHGQPLSGAEAMIWDTAGGDAESRALLIAGMRGEHARYEAGRENNTRHGTAGLDLHLVSGGT